MSRVVEVRAECSGLLQNISVGTHFLHSDEPVDSGGRDAGPTPYELLLAALGACTGITAHMYAEHKQWPLNGVYIKLTYSKVHAVDCASCETEGGTLDRIERVIRLTGDLSESQQQRLLEIANRCPVHRTLTPGIRIDTLLASEGCAGTTLGRPCSR